jgi:hypothetical protein
MEELGGSLYLMHKSGSDASLLSNDGTDLTLTQAVSSLGFGIGSRLAVKDADAFAIVDTVWQDPARRVVVYTGTATGGFTSVDTTTVNEIIDTSGFSDYGISSIDAAYNPASGDLGVVASDAGGETALFEYDGTSWSKVGESITAADADDYTVVRLVYDSTGTAYVVTGSTGSTWTGALRYDASAGAWEQLADAPNSSTKLSAVGVGNDTLHVCGAQNLGDSYAAYVWTFSE